MSGVAATVRTVMTEGATISWSAIALWRPVRLKALS